MEKSNFSKTFFHFTLKLSSLENLLVNEVISADGLCCLVAALVPDMFCNFYFVKNHKIANNSATTKARGKIRTYLEFLEF